MSGGDNKTLLATVKGERQTRPPIWMMRQAGRYLPEYREVRSKVEGFLELCYTPELASEVTLQPLKRFDLDAAILFSDILVVPHALGQNVRFEEGTGPILEPLTADSVMALDGEHALDRLAPVIETVQRVSDSLMPDKTLIGFCGSPWTVATYMIGGRGSADQMAARLFALQQPEAFARLMDILVEVSIGYLSAQISAGADVVQLFESWALNMDEVMFDDVVVTPNRRIVEGLRQLHPDAAVIGFVRGAAGQLPRYAARVGVDALGLHFAVPLAFARGSLPSNMALQGNLDPLRLLVGGRQMEERVVSIIEAFENRPHIFNLGHGILPQTPVENVERLVRLVKG